VEDDFVRETRERITDVDRRILEAVNERLRLVQELWRHKAEHGLPTLAPAREQWLLDHLAGLNEGPLSDDGLRRLFAEILALTKRELG
jgi:chorismate mutase